MNKEQINSNFFSLIPLPSWIYDYETLKILDVNIAAVEHYGFSREEFLRLTLKDLRPPQEVPRLISANTDIKNKEGNIYFGIFTHQKKNGTLIQMEINGHKVDFNDRLCILVVCQDVTEKIVQKEQIQQSERRFKALVDNSMDCTIIISPEGRCSYVSESVKTILGFTPTEAMDMDFRDIIHPEDLTGAENALAFSLKNPGVPMKGYISRVKHKNGSWRWVEPVITNLLHDPSVNGIVDNFRDITDQLEEQHKLKLLERVITQTNDAILITEAEPFEEPGPKIIYVNEAFTKMTGYTAEEVIGKTPRILQGPNSNQEELAQLGRALRNWESDEITTINYRKNGEEFWVNFTVTPVADEKGWYTHWFAIERDVTEQKQKELESELLGKISLNFSLENDLLTSSKALCKTICDFGRFDFAELWLPNIEYTEVKLVGKEAATSHAEAFYQGCQEINTFKQGEGLPGSVWSKKATLLWKDISKNDEFGRKEAVVIAGIQNALGIPLSFNNQVMGILVIATQQGLKYLEKYINLFEKLEHFIGSEINRRRLENDLSHFYQAIPDILCLVDFQGRFLKINNAGCELLGYSEEEILYHTCEKFVHPEDHEISFREISKLEKGKKTFKFENRYITKNGEIIWLSWMGNAAIEEGLIYATAKNITEEKRLRELNRLASSFAKIGSWEVDLTSDKFFWSEIVHQLHETDPESFVPDSANSLLFYRQDFHGTVSDQFEGAKLKGTPIDFEAVLITANKNERWVRVIGKAEFLKGQCKRIFGSFQDIHERKTAELAVLESEAKFRTIFDIATLGIAQVDPSNGKVILANSFYQTITGYTTKELMEMSFVELTHPDDRELDWGLFSNAAQGDGEYRNEKRYVKKDGTIVWVRLHVAFIRDKTGKPVKTVAICEDITDRKEAEVRLQNLSDNIPGVVFQYVIQTDGTDALRHVSKGAEKIWGYSPEAVTKNVELVWSQTKAGGDYEAVKQSIIDSIENKSIWSIKYRTVSPEGEKRILQGLGTPEFLADGMIIYNCVVLDITQEAKNEELLELATKLSRIGSWEIDMISNKLFWSHIIHELHETDPESFIPDLKTAINFYREDYIEMVNQCIANCIKKGVGFDFEAVIITSNKQERWVRTIGNAEIVDGKCERIYGSLQDIDDRKESELRLKSITDDLPGVAFQYIILPDGTDSMREVSKAADLIWNLSPKECEQNNDLVWNQIRKGGDFEAVQQTIAESIAKNKKWNFQWRNVLPNGEIRWHEGYGTPNVLVDGTTIFNSLIFDITDKYKAIELYDEASKLAKIGSWELNLSHQQGSEKMFWSPMVREILEVDERYDASLPRGYEFYLGESKQKIKSALEHLIETGESFDLELQVKTKKKHTKWIRCIGKAEFIDGKCDRIFGSYQDINLPKSLELQIREILESISDAFYGLDENWNFTYFNKEAENLLQRKGEDVLGKNMWEEFSPAKGTEIEEKYRYVAKTGKTETFEYCYPGDGKWYEINAYPSKGGVSVFFKNIDDRRKAAEELKKAYQEKNSIVESIADAFFTMDRNFIVSYWNRSAEELLGVKREQLIGNNLWDVFPDAVSLPSFSKYHEVLETRQPITFEDYYGIWLEVNAYPSEEGITVLFRDISLRKDADQRLLDAFEEKNNILESIGDAFFTVDKNWVVTYWNKEAEIVLERKREEIVGQNLWEIYDDALDTDFYSQYNKAMETGENLSFEALYANLDKWFEVSVYPSHEGLSVYFKDVTLRKKADIQLIQANERFEKVTDATNDAIWDYDTLNDELFWGKGFNTLFGYNMDDSEPSFDLLVSLIHDDDRERVATKVLQYMQDPKLNSWYEEYRFLKADGSFAFVIDRATFLRNDQGQVIRVIGAMTDISERKNFEGKLIELNESLQVYAKELERSNEELEQFAFITSHDLQEPLRMISSFMDQLKRKYENHLDEKALQYIHFATDGAKRMKQIILDLLDYSRAGKPTESLELVDIMDILSDYKQLRRKVILEKSVTIYTSDLPVIYSYGAAITQVFHSLLDNAIKYSKKGIPPYLEIIAKENEDEWIFSIKDNGIGIDKEFFENIFIIFQRLHNRSEYEGTGIGLSIAKKHVEFLGGNIWLESTLGQGSTFHFTIAKQK